MKPPDKSSMRQHWDSEAADYDSDRFLSPADIRVVELLKPEKGNRLLEIGFGTGVVATQIQRVYPELFYCGVDFSDNFVNIARRRLNRAWHLMKADGSTLPFKLETFDIILEMDAIHHFPRHIIFSLVEKATALLKPGGRFILAEDWAKFPADEREKLIYQVQARRHLTHVGLEYHPTEEEWMEMLERAGLTVQIERSPRPLNFRKFEILKDQQSLADMARLRQLWASESPTTLMTIFQSRKD